MIVQMDIPFIKAARKTDAKSAAHALGIARQTYAAYEKNPQRIKLPIWAKMMSMPNIFDASMLSKGLKDFFSSKG